MLYARMDMVPDRDNETLIEVYESRPTDRLVCWGGMNMRIGKPSIVFTPPHGVKHYSVKQERFFKVFLLAAHLHFMGTGEVVYKPAKPYDCYKEVFPREYYPFGTPQELPEFVTMG